MDRSGIERKPVIGITMGDPAGVGPEVIAKALKDKELASICIPVVIGDAGVMNRAAKLTGNRADLHIVDDRLQVEDNAAVLNLLDLNNLSSCHFEDGKISAVCGKASVEYILKAARLALRKQIDSLATAPIHKESTRLAGYGELGHLEILARYTNVDDYATMLVSENLRVIHLTTHYPLREAVEKIKKELIIKRLKLTQKAFSQWGYAKPVIGVAALNPHGGEGGILGAEEIEEIVPAIAAAREMGIEARGPYPADTIFNRALKGELDAVLALYHDQGHIPIKVHNVDKSFSIALGLPFIRTSVDHGTAFDIAWKGLAKADSMVEAIKAAVRLANNKL
ncbi:MAG TPA: 4-hydroxythreonine-4-phosphate dehydrogenase PdxA [Dehalococcoidales bacterium]|nr:4-hydroxythreonine-4-phosphate dehydrogenase PdxA [Dehalococcoidales bacterium]